MEHIELPIDPAARNLVHEALARSRANAVVIEQMRQQREAQRERDRAWLEFARRRQRELEETTEPDADDRAKDNAGMGNVIDSMFREAQEQARAAPHWVRTPQIEFLLNLRHATPPRALAGAFIQWANANTENDEQSEEMESFDSMVKLRAQSFDAAVRRRLMSFKDWVRNQRTGQPDPTNPDNVRVFLGICGATLRFNEWHRRAEIRERQPSGADGEWRPLSDAIVQRLITEAGNSQHQFRPADALFRRTLTTIARESSFDPLIDRLADLEAEWDGMPRLDTWLARACGVPNDAYHCAVARSVVGGLVSRARDPGCKHDTVLILIGPQGCGKSTLCRIIALENEYFTDSVVFDGSPQNVIPQLFGKWVVELSELGGMDRRDVQHVKRFLSTQSDTFTAKYEALASDHARRCCFIGTSNDANPLVDATGNRRWLPVHVPGEIDLAWLRANMGQIVGEACALHSEGERFAIPRDVWSAARERQEAAREVSPVEELILKWFDRPTVVGAGYYVTSADIVAALTLARQSPNAKFGEHMKRLSYVSENVVLPETGKRTRLWVRSATGGIAGCVRLTPAQHSASAPVEMQVRTTFPAQQPVAPVCIPPPPY